ncbi:hypothetical protein VAS14_16067 [Vibrio angustum S14]|uniref:Uncharacterized protein n=1 Tax=Photobacterium angustum (strain S14 / CCUG 15956) TaxID=314292 RepID=Q1ZMC7_PHOAS|nr:hypothetical protein VAS14_16067 [Vibrio angustum S14] [Photobacterium angustum S14]
MRVLLAVRQGHKTVSITLLVALPRVRDDLCEIQYQVGTQPFKAVLAFEVR